VDVVFYPIHRPPESQNPFIGSRLNGFPIHATRIADRKMAQSVAVLVLCPSIERAFELERISPTTEILPSPISSLRDSFFAQTSWNRLFSFFPHCHIPRGGRIVATVVSVALRSEAIVPTVPTVGEFRPAISECSSRNDRSKCAGRIARRDNNSRHGGNNSRATIKGGVRCELLRRVRLRWRVSPEVCSRTIFR
jgi:hypothetical protein